MRGEKKHTHKIGLVCVCVFDFIKEKQQLIDVARHFCSCQQHPLLSLDLPSRRRCRRSPRIFVDRSYWYVVPFCFVCLIPLNGYECICGSILLYFRIACFLWIGIFIAKWRRSIWVRGVASALSAARRSDARRQTHTHSALFKLIAELYIVIVVIVQQ